MLEFENTVQIERPIEEVFRFLADFENLPRWNYFVLNVEKTSAGPAGIGATYHQVRKTDEQTFGVTESDPRLGREDFAWGIPSTRDALHPAA